MRTFVSLLLATTLLATTPALADDWHGHGGEGHDHGFEGHDRGGEWHGDIHHFHEHDFDHWRGGGWRHEVHEGRDGWWWVVGGLWYFYPSPVYPFPDPYTPPEVVVMAAPTAPMPPSNVYYCANPPGYYPYVTGCLTAWQRMGSGVTVVTQQPMAQQPALVAPPQPAPVLDQHEMDRQQLNAYTAAYQRTNLNDPHARSHLRSLEKKIAAFRQTLYSRPYNAMDILRDADHLEHAIAEQRERLPH